jgi:hypothetical protein
MAADLKAQGNDFYKTGDVTSALSRYKQVKNGYNFRQGVTNRKGTIGPGIHSTPRWCLQKRLGSDAGSLCFNSCEYGCMLHQNTRLEEHD